MNKPASPWDELPDESVQQHLISFNQRTLIGFYYFFNRYYPLIFAYTFIKLREKKISEKIVNDSFTVIWTGKKTFETADDLKHYLLIIVRNKCIKHTHKIRKKYKASGLEADKLYLDGLEMVLEKFYKLSPNKTTLLKR